MEDGRKKGRVAGDATQNPKAMEGVVMEMVGGVRFHHVAVNFPLPGHFLRCQWGVGEGSRDAVVGGRPGSKKETLRGLMFKEVRSEQRN